MGEQIVAKMNNGELINEYPVLKKQFIAFLNKEKTISELTKGSRLKVKWKCENFDDHVWVASPNQRLSGGSLRGCPFCAGKIATWSNSLAKHYPDIASTWSKSLNDGLKPDKITPGSNKKVWWECSNGHSWEASPKQRTKGNNSCPRCNSLYFKYPKIAKEWHPTKNGDKLPSDFAGSAHAVAWWKCPKGGDHEWKAKINTRTSVGSNCPICSGHKVVKSNSFATVFPELAEQWHSKNDISPKNLYAYSRKKVWWKCPKGNDHEWQATVRSRAKGMGCPVCSGRKVAESNCLSTRFPEIAKLWNVSRNNISANEVTPYSNKKVWWKCPKGEEHEWQASVANVVGGSTCPVCMNRKIVTNNNLLALFPKLNEEWDYDKNTIDPLTLSAGSREKVWWACKKDNEHQWLGTIRDRTKSGSGCPYCASKFNVSELKMLDAIKEIFPDEEVLYCTRPKFLEGLEIDVFLPNLKLGFEYQGQQHFFPVEIFGGKEAFEQQIVRDELKKKICDAEGITLLYVNYDEKISSFLIKNKLRETKKSAI